MTMMRNEKKQMEHNRVKKKTDNDHKDQNKENA